MAITDYDSTAGNNTTINGINIAEGCAPAGINNAIREVMADLAVVVDLFYPVGSLHISSAATSPSVRFPGTTWAQVADGRAIVGVGTSDTADAYAWTQGQKRGLETHALTEAELAAHTHGPGTLGTDTTGAHTHSYSRRNTANSMASGGDPTATNGTSSLNTGSAGNHSHSVTTGVTASAGSDTAHNNLQPSIAYYIWERTA